MKKFLFILLIFGSIISEIIGQQIIDKTITHNNETRAFSIFLPTGYTTGASLPMLFNLHGLGSNKLQQMIYTGFNTIADTANVIVVYPQGLSRMLSNGTTGTHWNSHFGTDVDDLGFLDTLIDYMFVEYDIDLSRVYSTGMSNGGYMSYMLGCELSDRIAAIASVTGAMSFPQITACNPAQPMPIMEIHGTDDSTVLYNGVPLFYPSIPTGVNWWVTSNNCQQNTTTNLPNIDTTDNSTVTLEVHDQCTDNVEVHFYTINGGGHSWPGAFPVASLGNTNQDFIASKVIWQFFSKYQHPNPKQVTVSTKTIDNQSKIKVSPNPFTDFLQVDFEEMPIQRLELLDAMGRLIQTWEQPNNNRLKINTENLRHGVYFLQVVMKEGKVVKKLVK